jgi:hypothetical protein
MTIKYKVCEIQEKFLSGGEIEIELIERSEWDKMDQALEEISELTHQNKILGSRSDYEIQYTIIKTYQA